MKVSGAEVFDASGAGPWPLGVMSVDTKWVGAGVSPRRPPLEPDLRGRIRLTQDVALKRAKDDGCVPGVRGTRDRARRRTSSATCDDRHKSPYF